MRAHLGYTLIELLIVVVIIGIALPWLVNAYKFANCDFESPYKCEAIHAVGIVVPPLGVVTVWFDTDSK